MRAVCSERRRGAVAGPALLVLLISLILPGCSVKLAYNNLDRLAVWQAEDYVELSGAQKDWLRTRMRIYLYWHRTEQLPQWSSALRRLKLQVADGISDADLVELALQGDAWGQEMILQFAPVATDMLLAMDDEQLADLPEAFARSNAELNEDYAGLTPAEQREQWREEVRDFLDDWIGRLTPAQQRLLEDVSSRVVPDNGAWLRYRARWQAELLAQLARRQDHPSDFTQVFYALALHYERYWTEEYRQVRALNEPLYREFTVRLLNDLEPRQYDKLADRLDDVAEDFDDLAADAGTPPADPGPFPTR